MRRDDVASTSVRSHFDVLCLLGIYYSDHLLQDSVKLLLTHFFFLFFMIIEAHGKGRQPMRTKLPQSYRAFITSVL